MQTKKSSEIEDRDSELENILGNLLIAEYQVEKLRGRLIDKISSPYSASAVRDGSSYSFKHNGKWYRIAVRIEQDGVVARSSNDLKT
jgi:hypothetical protein